MSSSLQSALFANFDRHDFQTLRHCAACGRGVCVCVPILHREDSVAHLTAVLETPVLQESNSACVVMGARGAGKSIVIQFALKALQLRHPDVSIRVVRLSGAVHTTEKSAVQSALDQLNVVLEERLQGRSVERKLVAIADSLQNSATQQAVVFVLDEYDLFALRAKQTLLYNLYDMSHAKLRVCVLGVSTKFNCLELLEKRVRSRAGATQLPLFDYTNEQLLSILQSLLRLPHHERWNAALEKLCHAASFKTVFARVASMSSDVRLLHRWIRAALFAAQQADRLRDVATASLTETDFTVAFERLNESELVVLISSLSMLELAVLRIATYAAAKQPDQFLPAQYTFAQLYSEYRSVVVKHDEWKPVLFEQAAVFAAFENLLDCCVLTFTDSAVTARNTPTAKRPVQLLLAASALEAYYADARRTLPSYMCRPGSFYK